MVDKAEIKKLRRQLLAGKTTQDLVRARDEQIHYVYYTDSGSIKEVTTEPTDSEHSVAKFTHYQLSQFDDFSPDRYMVTVINGKAIIERKPETKEYINADKQFLYELKPHTDADVTVIVTDNKFRIELSEIAKQRAQRLATTNLKFYLTKPNDPHIMYDIIKVNTQDLISDYECDLNINKAFGVYTMTVFDTYSIIRGTE